MTEVMIGDKRLSRYQDAVNTQLEDHDEVHVLSRGQENNGKALDLAEINRREKDSVVVDDISTETAMFENDDGKEVHVTDLQIVIKRE
jgi:DNA-binding protein Alba